MPTTAWYQQSIEDIYQALHSSPPGLTSAEAAKRLLAHGPNQLPAPVTPGPFLQFIRQFANPLIYILLFVAIATLVLRHYLDSAIILGIVIINAVIGFYQELQAQESLAKLGQFLNLRCQVLRDDEPHEVNAKVLVPGDIILVEPGSKIPADLRIVENIDLRVDESVLTGEAIPVAKKVAPITASVHLNDRRNMLFSGTFVTSGRGRGIVVATGGQTEFGRIAASLTQATPPPSPLQIQLSLLTKQLIITIVAAIALIILVGFWRHLHPLIILLTGVNLAVSVIPEGLPAVLTITLALGVRRMARQHAIVRNLPAIETLGSVTLIATDKTGTLTRDEMMVEQIYLDPQFIQLSGNGYQPEGKFHHDHKMINPATNLALKRLLTIGTLCSNTSLIEEDGQWKIIGDPTEGALIVAAAKANLAKPDLEEHSPRLDEIPFHTAKRFMATLNQRTAGDHLIAVKGATEKILPFCSTFYHHNRRHRLSEKDRQRLLSVNQTFTSQGYRVLAIAFKDGHDLDKINEHDLTNSTFLGFCAINDSPRPEARQAILRSHQAGIGVVMLTGDHALTAQHVATSLGISDQSSTPPITGEELDTASPSRLKKLIQTGRVFARISPLNKINLVQHFQHLNQIVAVTGDGINDAPALKQADIGIAMGKTGTDVSREAADMVLANDNFSTIVYAIEEGRTIYQNVKRVILYLLSTNVGELLVIAAALLFGLPLPLQPVQILWINLITDGAATIPLALEPKHANIMRYPPRAPGTPIIDQLVRWRILLVAVTMAVGTVWLYQWELARSGYVAARTVAFETMVLFQLFNMFNSRSLKESVLKLPLFNNYYVIFSFIIALLLTIVAIYLPWLQSIFYTSALSLNQWLRIIAVCLSVIVVVEIEKWLRSHWHLE